MAAVRTYKVVLREAEQEVHDYGTFFVTKFELFNEDPTRVLRATLEAESLDELDARLTEVFRENTDWDYASVYVDVADGKRKPNGFKARYDKSRILKREEVAA